MTTSDFAAGEAAPGGPSMTVVTNHELFGDTHAAFRRIRSVTPVAMHESGVFIITRAKDIEALAKDDRLRATTTEFPQMMDFPEGALFNFFRYGMLTSNGQDHRRRRAPFSTACRFPSVRSPLGIAPYSETRVPSDRPPRNTTREGRGLRKSYKSTSMF